MTTRFVLAVVFAVAAAGCGSSNTTVASPSPSSSGTSSGTSISIVPGASVLSTTAYAPGSLTLSKGSSVTFVNNDSAPHTATASGTFDTGIIAPGGRSTITFQNAGAFTYKCTIHPNMTGTVVVQ